MGIFSGRDLYSARWINAEIDDMSGRRWVVPIKYAFGDYFLAELNGLIYCFLIDFKSIKYYRGSGIKTIRFLNYSVFNYTPINSEKLTALRQFLDTHQLPAVDHKIFNVMRMLHWKEKKEKIKSTVHDLAEFAEAARQRVDDPSMLEIAKIVTELPTDQIVAPVGDLSEFLNDELATTKPEFVGNLVSQYRRLDESHRSITNAPLTAKQPYMKLLLIMGILMVTVFAIYYVYEEGYLDSSLGSISSISDFTSQFTPEELKQKVDDGEIDEKDIPKDLRELIKNLPDEPDTVELTPEPEPEEVEIDPADIVTQADLERELANATEPEAAP